MALGSSQPLTEMSVLKSEILNLLEPLGPIQACNEIALPLPVSYLACSFIKLPIGLLLSRP